MSAGHSSGVDRTPADDPDVCVVGAGPAGALLAHSLTERGHDVVVLEAGPRFDAESRLERTQQSVRPAVDAAETWDMGGERDRYTTSGERDWPLNDRRVKGVGGTTLHWGGVTPRFREEDFEMESRYGVARDWPIGYDDLRPYYAEAERKMDVAGDDDAPFQPPREQAFPRESVPPSHSDQLFAEAAEKLGISVQSVPTVCHPAPREERTQGDEDGQFVRPPDSKYSADVHVDSAVARGARLIDRAPVRRLEHGPDGERVTEAVYTTPDGQTHRQAADVFVAACGTVETARLLLLSDSSQYPDGLANSSGLVGRYLLAQPPAAVVGVVDEPTKQGQVATATSGIYQFYDGEGERGSINMTLMNSAGRAPAELALERESWGDRLLEEVEFHHGNTVGVSIHVECLPQADNRISLNESVTDDYGNPVPDVQFSPGAFARSAQEKALAVGTDLVEALDGAVVHADGTATGGDTPPSAEGGHHALGGARMGTDPAESVVDPTLRAHDLANLYVAGGSPFVTSGAANPALTIAALSLRAADHIDAAL